MRTTSPRGRRTVVAGATLTGAVLALTGVVALGGADASPGTNAALAATTNPDGSPKSGFDPANQAQTSLRSAAGRPATLPRVVKVDGSADAAADSKGVNSGTKKQVASGPATRIVKPSDVLSQASKTGGCRPEYGDHGQCLPYVPPSHRSHPDHPMDHAWSCTEMRTLFPQGIALRQAGVDPLGVDTNHDDVACDSGDAP